MTTHSFEKPILVLGATGKTGRRVAERLAARGLAVRAGSRNASPAFDWNDSSTWASALDGVSAVYISYYPDLAVPGAQEAVEALAKLAVGMGVRRMVLLSGRGEEEAQATEEALKLIGADLTIVRASWFNQNFSEGAFLDYILAGEVALPVGDVREPFVDADDIADIVVSALTGDWHIGQTYEVTGPRLLTFAEAVGEIAAAAGRDVQCANHAGRIPRRHWGRWPAAGYRLAARRTVHARARWPQRISDRRRGTRARPPAAQLHRLCLGNGGARRLEHGAGSLNPLWPR